MGATYTEAQARATREYEARTYKKELFKFRLDDDADIIESLQDAKDSGITKNEWMRAMFEGGGIAKKDVAAAMQKYGIQQNLINLVLNEL